MSNQEYWLDRIEALKERAKPIIDEMNQYRRWIGETDEYILTLTKIETIKKPKNVSIRNKPTSN